MLSSDKTSAESSAGQLRRDIDPNYEFDSRNLEPIARCLRSALMALGHSASAYNTFVKIKSRDVSPDGLLGGQGFVQSVTDMRRLFAECVEALSSLSDTLYDELKAPHWSPEAQQEAEGVMQDVEVLREDPERWAEEEEEFMDSDEDFEDEDFDDEDLDEDEEDDLDEDEEDDLDEDEEDDLDEDEEDDLDEDEDDLDEDEDDLDEDDLDLDEDEDDLDELEEDE